MSRRNATLLGFSAVLLWSLLAFFTVGSAPVPPLQLNAMTFAVGGLTGLVWVMARGGIGQLRQVPLKVYAFGAAGLFGYHFFYFSALRLAPAAEAGLIAYLWPLLIVLLSGLLPGERLRAGHILGAVLAFGGAALLIAKGRPGGDGTAALGYGFALACALIWSGYSVLSRRLGSVPTSAVAVYCVLTALLSAPAHFYMETTVWPLSLGNWLAVLGLGLGPVGIAFFTWDIGVKRGDIQLLGTLSYAAPLLSTLVLIVTGHATPTSRLLFAAILIAAGAALAARAAARQVNSD
ncbi:MAG: EamA family transporter [Rhodobacteraceae bacterium]|nr:EamA family transporter [Paracoccaceae bacterium]